MEILFCYLNESDHSQPIDWKEEADAAEECGFTCHSFSYDLFHSGQIEAALNELPKGNGTEILYRGWLIPEDDYQMLDDCLSGMGYQLITPTHQYSETLLLPNYFELIEDISPPCLWTEDPDIEEAWELAKSVGDGPWIIRDHMKSAKEAWLEACYVPENASFDEFHSICSELRDRRGEWFSVGYVIRPFISLKQLGVHWTGSPVSEEYRMIFWKGEAILSAPYYELGSFESLPDLTPYKNLAEKIDSDFFVADVAVKEDGNTTLIELNPGGPAGIPPQTHPIELYERLRDRT